MADGIFNLPPGILTQEQGTQLMGAGNQMAKDQAMNAGLMAAGAGLLAAPNLREGLAAGLTGFNRAYDTELLANRPKVIPLANGAFSQISFPDGRVEVVRNDQVERFLKEQETIKAMNKFQLEEFRSNLQSLGKAEQDDVAAAKEAGPLLRSTNELLGMYGAAQDIVKAQAGQTISIPGIGSISTAAIQGMAPGLAGFFGGDQAAANKFLQQLKVAETLANTALTKGAISNAEMSLFMSPIPNLTDDREKVWKPWLEARIPVLQKIQKFYQEQAARGQTTRGAQIQAGQATAMPVTPPTTPKATNIPAPKFKTGDADIDKYL